MCPSCNAAIPEAKFLCNVCAERAPDLLIVQIGAALDGGDTQLAAAVISEAVTAIGEG